MLQPALQHFRDLRFAQDVPLTALLAVPYRRVPALLELQPDLRPRGSWQSWPLTVIAQRDKVRYSRGLPHRGTRGKQSMFPFVFFAQHVYNKSNTVTFPTKHVQHWDARSTLKELFRKKY